MIKVILAFAGALIISNILIITAEVIRSDIDSTVPNLQHLNSIDDESYAPIYYGGEVHAGALSSQEISEADMRYGKHWIVTLKENADVASVTEECTALESMKGDSSFQCKISRDMLEIMNMFEVDGTLTDILQLRVKLGSSCVSIERDLGSSAMKIPWHLDRIDQNFLPLDGKPFPHLLLKRKATPMPTGRNVSAYILDSGVDIRHHAFDTINIGESRSFVTDDPDGVADAFVDIYNHGTHVASIVGAVAQGITIHSVKVLNNNGNASWSIVIRGLSWVIKRQLEKDISERRTCVVSMSLAGLPSVTIERAIQNAVNAGISIVTSAGNFFQSDACKYSPPLLPETIAVGSLDKYDRVATFSNVGSCVDVYAPGVGILAANAKSVGTRSRAPMIKYSGTVRVK